MWQHHKELEGNVIDFSSKNITSSTVTTATFVTTKLGLVLQRDLPSTLANAPSPIVSPITNDGISIEMLEVLEKKDEYVVFSSLHQLKNNIRNSATNDDLTYYDAKIATRKRKFLLIGNQIKDDKML